MINPTDLTATFNELLVSLNRYRPYFVWKYLTRKYHVLPIIIAKLVSKKGVFFRRPLFSFNLRYQWYFSCFQDYYILLKKFSCWAIIVYQSFIFYQSRLPHL